MKSCWHEETWTLRLGYAAEIGIDSGNTWTFFVEQRDGRIYLRNGKYFICADRDYRKAMWIKDTPLGEISCIPTSSLTEDEKKNREDFLQDPNDNWWWPIQPKLSEPLRSGYQTLILEVGPTPYKNVEWQQEIRAVVCDPKAFSKVRKFHAYELDKQGTLHYNGEVENSLENLKNLGWTNEGYGYYVRAKGPTAGLMILKAIQ